MRQPVETAANFTPKVPTSGFAKAALYAVNPSNEDYAKIVGREVGYQLTYDEQNGKIPVKMLVKVGNEFVLIDTWGLGENVPTSTKDGVTNTMYLNEDTGDTCWKPTVEQAVEWFTYNDVIPNVKECRSGEEIYTIIMASIPSVMYKEFFYDNLESDIRSGNWAKFNSFVAKNSLFMEFVFFFYSVTNDKGYVNLKADRSFFSKLSKFVGKDNTLKNISYQITGMRKSLNSAFYQKPGVFCENVQWGLVEQGKVANEVVSNDGIVEADADNTDDLPW